MSVSRDDVEHVARLASLAVDEPSLATLTQQIGQILEYVSQLEAVEDPGGTIVAAYPGPRQPLRDDTASRTPLLVPLTEIAPAFRDGLFLVPRLGAVGADAASPTGEAD
jgi:aspartyl-tRNA(Asn)/glutamyl-tRNA(Gln) amidotransferase subunit C